MNPYQVVKDFEKALCEYTGAKYAVTTNSCTMALLLVLSYWFKHDPWWCGDTPFSPKEGLKLDVILPSRTYISVPQSIIHAGGHPVFDDYEWSGSYRLDPYPIWDSARRFTSNMFQKDQMQCVSFHASKILGDTQGGAILHDNDEADAWLRRARFDGRTEGVTPKNDTFTQIGWHCYMSPDVAARLLFKLSVLPKHNKDLPNDDYPDLSKMSIFK